MFVAFAGEEQGLYGSDHFAELAKQKGWNIQGILNMDIVGSPNGGNGAREPHAIRLFSEGVPTAETPAQTARRQAIGGENDGVSRQLARFVKETGENDATGMKVKLIWRRDRFLRSGDQVSFLERGWPAVRFTEPNENFDHEHQDVRVEDGTQFGDLPEFVDYHYLARVTRVVGSSLARSPARRARRATPGSSAPELSYDTELRGTRTRSPTSSATRSCGGIRPSRCGPTCGGSATSPRHDRGPEQGRRPGRGPRDRPRREPQPGRVPDPVHGSAACRTLRARPAVAARAMVATSQPLRDARRRCARSSAAATPSTRRSPPRPCCA